MLNLLLGSKGSAVGALAFGGISLVGNYLNFVKRAVVFGVAVVFALSNGAADRFICSIALICSARIGSVVHYKISFRN